MTGKNYVVRPAPPLVLHISLVFYAGESKKMFSPWQFPTHSPVFFYFKRKLPDKLAFLPREDSHLANSL